MTPRSSRRPLDSNGNPPHEDQTDIFEMLETAGESASRPLTKEERIAKIVKAKLSKGEQQ